MSLHTADPRAHPDPDLESRERWAAAIYELMTHATDQSQDPRERAILAGAAEDALALKHAMVAAGDGLLDDEQTEVLQSIYDLWNVNQDRHERLAALVDDDFHRRWATRTASARPERPA